MAFTIFLLLLLLQIFIKSRLCILTFEWVAESAPERVSLFFLWYLFWHDPNLHIYWSIFKPIIVAFFWWSVSVINTWETHLLIVAFIALRSETVFQYCLCLCCVNLVLFSSLWSSYISIYMYFFYMILFLGISISYAK